MNRLPSFALIFIHFVLLACALSRHVAVSSRWLAALIAFLGILVFIAGVNRLPAFLPSVLGVATRIVGYAWALVLGFAVCFLMLFVPVLEPGPTLNIGSARVASYVGCDGATTDPCIIIRREWRPLPYVAIYRQLWTAPGREFSLTPVDDHSVRINAPAFKGEGMRKPLELVLRIQ
jgi:hypothetical protein